MKNDFDFIREQFDGSGVNAPENMGEDFVAKRLEGLEPVAEVENKNKKKRYWIPAGISAAAAVAVLTATALISYSLVNNLAFQKPVKLEKAVSSHSASLFGFKSREEVVKTVERVNKANDKRMINYYGNYAEAYAEDGAAAGTGSAKTFSGESLGHNTTYVQHTGVDEADKVKTDGKYIYYMSGNQTAIDIYSADGENSKKVASVSSESKSDSNYRCFSEFYINGSRLVTLGTYSVVRDKDGNAFDPGDDIEYSGEYTFDTATFAEVFDISDIGNIRQTGSFSQSGNYCSSRMIGDMLYIVTTDYAENGQDLPFICAEGNDIATADEIPTDCIYSVENPVSPNFMVVSSLDTSSNVSLTRTKAILGSADIIYCNQQNLYVTAYLYSNAVYNSFFDNSNSEASYSEPESTQIVKLSLDKGLDITAVAAVDGRIDDQYALDEYEGNLRVATTLYLDGRDVNNLFVLDEKLEILGSVTGFAENESIKAVRYIGSTAYVITYEQTDPLFVIDASDPANPAILGEVKISGFSTMLVPVDDNTLLGIGYYTQDEDDGIDMEIQEGLKLALFDVSDKSAPRVLDEKVFKNYYSEVQYNPKALVVNYERGDYVIPFSYNRFDYERDTSEQYSGSLNFRVANGKLEIIDEYVSDVFGFDDDIISGAYLERCAYTGDYIYLLGWGNKGNKGETVIDSVRYKAE